MNWQLLLVGIIVVAALVFAIWRLPGRATRLRLVSGMKRMSGGHGPLARLAMRLEARLRGNGSPCAGCSAADSHPPSR